MPPLTLGLTWHSAEAEKPFQHQLFPGKISKDRTPGNNTHPRLDTTKAWMDVSSCDRRTSPWKRQPQGLLHPTKTWCSRGVCRVLALCYISPIPLLGHKQNGGMDDVSTMGCQT